jgi:hypothetical protein
MVAATVRSVKRRIARDQHEQAAGERKLVVYNGEWIGKYASHRPASRRHR